MLPTAQRLHTAREFSAVMRSGRRGASTTVVVHLLSPAGTGVSSTSSVPAGPARAGFVVAGKVGNSVVRHRITRRLRPVVREALGALPPGTDVVVRALPPAADADTVALMSDFRTGLAKAQRAGSRRAAPAGGRP